MSADRFSSDTDVQQLHELRKARHLRLVVDAPATPSDSSLELPPLPEWMRPVPRVSRHSSPPIFAYQRERYDVRTWCDRIPGLKYLARLLW